MAGLVAAARARELGAEVVVFEKGDRAGGSMLLSSGVIWRHRTADAFHDECPGGDLALQRLLVEELDGALDWLESLGAPVTARETGNALTVGRRFDPRGLTDVDHEEEQRDEQRGYERVGRSQRLPQRALSQDQRFSHFRPP